MKTIINKILMKIAESVDTHGNTISSVRLQSYLILLPILMMVLVFLTIEIWSFVHAIKHGVPYRLSSEIIIVFGMMLSHHLAILFSRTKSQSVAEISGANAAAGAEAPAADAAAVDAGAEAALVEEPKK